MEFNVGKSKIKFSFYFFCLLVLFLLLDKTGFILYMLAAIAAHEAGHITAMLAVGVKVGVLSFTPFGLWLERREGSMVSCAREIIISLAGSTVNLILAKIFLLIPQSAQALVFSAFNMALGLFNLLPIKGLDGGSIVCEVLEYCFENRGRKAAHAVSVFFTIMLFLSAMYLWYIDKLNISLVGLCIYLIILLFRRT